jgi:hypothetical protein
MWRTLVVLTDLNRYTKQFGLTLSATGSVSLCAPMKSSLRYRTRNGDSRLWRFMLDETGKIFTKLGVAKRI